MLRGGGTAVSYVGFTDIDKLFSFLNGLPGGCKLIGDPLEL